MVRKQKPNWWLLYLTVPLMLGLLVIESQMPHPLVIHRVAEFAIVLFGFGLMFLWVRANEGGLIDEEIEKEPWAIESDPSSRVAIDPDLLLSADGCDDSEDDEHRLEASPTRGRYN